MPVRIQDQLHILDAEAERTDVRGDRLRRFGQRRIEQHVPVLGRDQDRAQSARADVVRVAVDAEGDLLCVPLGTGRAFAGSLRAVRGLGGQRRGQQEQENGP